MVTKLHISNALSLPLDAVMKQHLIVGQSGSGKTNLGVVLVEELAKADQQYVVIDEPGVWWGLRSRRDGQAGGLDVFILGGEHGDVPLEPTSGAIIADFVVTSGHSVILDLSMMRRGQVTLFMLEFCQRIYEAKAAAKTPLHLVFDEADLYCPDVPHEKGNGKHLLDAIDTIARRGRSRGLQETFITQRPQVISKSIIAQSDVLHVFRLSHPLDRKALDSWVRSNATSEQIETFTNELASLERGHCFVWSPEWLKMFKRVHIRQRETFDSSMTPEVGVAAKKPRVMTQVDIAALRAQILETIEVQKAEDPKVLRAQIDALRAQIAQLAARPPVVEATRVEVPVLTTATADALRSIVEDFVPLVEDMRALVGTVSQAIARVEYVATMKPNVARPPSRAITFTEAGQVEEQFPHVSPEERAKIARKLAESAQYGKKFEQRSSKAASRNGAKVANGNWTPSKMARNMLEVLAQRHGRSTTLEQLSMLTGYSISGSFSKSLAELRAHDAVSGERGDVNITSVGLAHVPDPRPMPMGRALLDVWLAKLAPMERKILEVVYAAHPRELAIPTLARECDYKVSGSFSKSLARLRKTHLLAGRSTRLGPALAEATS